MLSLLQIDNIAVIEKAELNFSIGMNVLTGETGAGKSIVIDALHAVTGGRIGREIIRTGESFAAVSAVFSQTMEDDWYESNGIERGENDEIILFRKLTADGKNTCRINGHPVTLAQLRAVGTDLIDIHGQNDGRRLLDESSHLNYLDSFCSDSNECGAYRTCFNHLTALRNNLKELDIDEGERARHADMLSFQIEEIERINPIVGEYDELTAKRDFVRNAARLTESLDSAYYALHGSDHSDGALTLTEEAENELLSAARYTDRFQLLTPRLSKVRSELDDISEELRDIRRELDFSPGELDELETRISILKRMMKKYGGSEESALDTLEKARNELDSLSFSDEIKQKLEHQIAETLAQAEKAAEKLSYTRKKGAKILQEKILNELSSLNMGQVRFEVHFDEVELGREGKDHVSFLMSANAGEKPGKISRIASGGELSRIMLAMKNVLAENDCVGTMVFDEIDTGVSGIAAQRVGEKLWTLGRCRQVLCVTHLPQIAVMADAHFSVEKHVDNERTKTQTRHLDLHGRMAEIARLAGGENITSLTLDSAKEQLDAAEAYKRLTKQ